MDWGGFLLVLWLSHPLLPPVSSSFVPPLHLKKKNSLSYLVICCVDVGKGKRTCGCGCGCSRVFSPLRVSFLVPRALSADQRQQTLHPLSKICLTAFSPLEQPRTIPLFYSHLISKHRAICNVPSQQSLNQRSMKK